MRQRARPTIVAAAAVLFALAGATCSSSDSSSPLDVVFTHAQGQGGQPFTATGAAVDAGLVCSDGTMDLLGFESMEGDERSEGDWADMFDSALESNGVAEMFENQTWTCAAGDGSFTLTTHNRLDFAVFAFEGQQDIGTWEITEATDALEDLTGSGTATLDWDAEQVTLIGTIER